MHKAKREKCTLDRAKQRAHSIRSELIWCDIAHKPNIVHSSKAFWVCDVFLNGHSKTITPIHTTHKISHHPAATVAVINHYVAGFRLQNNLLILSTPQKYNDLYSIECVFNCNTHKSYQVSILISERNFLICFAISFLNIY